MTNTKASIHPEPEVIALYSQFKKQRDWLRRCPDFDREGWVLPLFRLCQRLEVLRNENHDVRAIAESHGVSSYAVRELLGWYEGILETRAQEVMSRNIDRSERVRLTVAQSPATPPEMLVNLIDDPCTTVRRSAARNIAYLAKYGSAERRRIIASDPHTPVCVFATLIGDPSKAVRRAVAKTSSDATILHGLSADPSLSVRLTVAENPNTGLGTTIFLDFDKNALVRKQAKLARGYSPHLIRKR
jgi:hypothetical protein